MTYSIRHDWTREEALALFDKPLNDLLFEAQTVHREYFNPNEIQASTLCNIKTGGCAEDCKYCSQSSRYDTGLKAEKLLPAEEVVEQARAAKAAGATRFCMGAAWRNPKERDMPKLTKMISEVKALGMETCATLGMLTAEQAKELQENGLDYYNHNLDTSEEYYGEVITTRSYQDRLDTLANVRDAGMKTCCGGIVGMGESRDDRAAMLKTLANLPVHPQSVPINMLVQVEGTPMQKMLEGIVLLPPIEFVKTIAVARLMMPKSYVRLSAGREEMSTEMQAMCFFAGANSIFYGETLLTTENPQTDKDKQMLTELGVMIEGAPVTEAKLNTEAA